MSVAATQASKFYEQVIAEGRVFTVDDGEGYLVFPIGEIEVVPFWSSRSRLVNIQKDNPKYEKWEISEEPLSGFLDKTLPLLDKEGIRVGVNWSGKRLNGFDISVPELRKNLQHWIDKKNDGEQGVDPNA